MVCYDRLSFSCFSFSFSFSFSLWLWFLGFGVEGLRRGRGGKEGGREGGLDRIR